MAKLIFCYQFDTFDGANEFIMKLYAYYSLMNHEFPVISDERLSYNQVIIESFSDSYEAEQLLEIMNLLAAQCDGYIESCDPKHERRLI